MVHYTHITAADNILSVQLQLIHAFVSHLNFTKY